MRRNSAKNVALGGVMAALAIVIMCLGGLIPLATYVCPMFCAVLLMIVLKIAGSKIAWAWYGAVAILSVLLGPDKEAAAVFVFLGYYPIIKPWLDKRKLAFLWKLALFNAAIFVMYSLLIYVFGLSEVVEEFKDVGLVMTVITLVLGNVTLFMLDMMLSLLGKRKKNG
ncbi:MAG: hypothetical protein IJW14_00510 [Oscillospiraceae bacterium]|nr:hypothetical protein [Oscillospiraceae bacterium]